MPLPEPTFDTRGYRELLNEALARIPTHNPEWTNFNDSDPGVTLLQLFAFISEAIIYRANLIPERNRSKFLRLLGIPMRAAEPALGMVSFTKPKGDLKTSKLDADESLEAGKVPFRTRNGLYVLPVEARLYYKSPLSEPRKSEVKDIYSKLYASYDKPEQTFGFYETKTFEIPSSGATLSTIDLSLQTEDGSLWLALLARPGDCPDKARSELANKEISIGILPALSEEGKVLHPRGQSPVDDHPALIFEIPNMNQSGGAAYKQLKPKTNVDLLNNPGVVEISLPDKDELNFWKDLDPLEPGVGNYPPWIEDSDDLDRLITWIRIRSPEIDVQTEAISRQVSVALSWVGINAATIIQCAHVSSEQLPRGTGEPDQTARLTHTPVIINTVQLGVNGEQWTRVDDLMAAKPEIEVRSPRFAADRSATVAEASLTEPAAAFTVDRESGEIRFGDGIHGKRPPRGAVIQVSYDYGGGKEGRVGIGSINKGSNLNNGVKVINPVPTWGGDRPETVAEAEKRVPAFLRHRDRLVSKTDYEDIARNTPGVDLGRVEVLPLVHPDHANQISEGLVTLLVIPESDPRQPDAPSPDPLFLEAMCGHLAPRRILTTELHICGPKYEPVWLSISIDVIPGYDAAPVREKVRQALFDFLSPLKGGFEKNGWPLEKAVEAPEIAATAARVAGVSKVNELLVGGTSGERTEPIAMEGLQLPRVMAVAVVTSGDAPSIEEIKGDVLSSEPGAGTRTGSVLPVPIVPEIC